MLSTVVFKLNIKLAFCQCSWCRSTETRGDSNSCCEITSGTKGYECLLDNETLIERVKYSVPQKGHFDYLELGIFELR